MKKTTTLLIAVASTALLVSCASRTASVAPGYLRSAHSFDNEIPKNEVPVGVLAAAKDKIPDFVLENANLQKRGATVLYELQGRAHDHSLEIDVTADGRVLHIERN